MLVEFSFSNFRSFKEEANFSMEPASLNGNEYNVIRTNLKRVPLLYRSSGIFGANASGKSNILSALGFFRYIVKRSINFNVEDKFPSEFYALADGYDKQPMTFGIKFILNEMLYDYKFSLLENIVNTESLYSYNISQTGTNRPNMIFERNYVDGKMSFKKSTGISQSWCNEVLDNRLFLPDIVNTRKCEIASIKEVYNWIINKISFVDIHKLNEGFSLHKIFTDSDKDIINLMKKADLGLEKIEVKDVSSEEFLEKVKQSKHEIPTKLAKALDDGKAKIFDARSYHKMENGDTKPFSLDDMESDGTKTFLAISGPILDVLENGKILIVDEMDNALHPLLVKYIVDMFNNPEINKKNAQLIFASHAYYLMDGNHLTRDQIWFVDKAINNGYSSSLYSLSDFKNISTRKTTSFVDAYMSGIYGATPNVEDF